MQAATMAAPIAVNPCCGEICHSQSESGLSETEVDHSPVRTRGQGHFLARRGKPAKPELHRGVPLPDQYGCGNPDGTDPFLTLLSEYGGRLVTGANPLPCLPLIDD